MSTLADRLKAALVSMTPPGRQADLAKACGITGPSVSNWFTGETKRLKAESAILAADYLGVRPRWLIDGIGPMRQFVAGEPEPSYDARPKTLGAALAILGQALAGDFEPEVREDLADALAKLAHRHGHERQQKEVLRLLGERWKPMRAA